MRSGQAAEVCSVVTGGHREYIRICNLTIKNATRPDVNLSSTGSQPGPRICAASPGFESLFVGSVSAAA